MRRRTPWILGLINKTTAEPSVWATYASPTVPSLTHSSQAFSSCSSGVHAIQQLPFANSRLGVRKVVISLLFVIPPMLERPANQLENACDHKDRDRKLEPARNSEKESTTKHDETEQTEGPSEMVNKCVDK